MSPVVQGPSKTLQFRDFSKGMNQTDARMSIADNELFWSENAQPVGNGQLQIVQPQGPTLTSIAAGIVKMFGVLIKISGVETTRLITVNKDNSMTAVDPATGSQTVIAPANTVTSATRVAIWQDGPLLIGDVTKGYFSWDGTTLLHYPLALTGSTTSGSAVITGMSSTSGLVAGMSLVSPNLPPGATILTVDSATQLTASVNATATGTSVAITVGAGAPTSVADLATFEGRAVLVSANRSLTFSAPASYTDFQTGDGSITVSLTDSVFPGKIVRILSALEVLWTLGPGAVNALSNVQISTGNVTTVSNTNIVSNIGTIWPSSVSSFFRTFLFLTPYGVYAVVGATPQKLSDKLNLLFPQLQFGTDQPSAVFTLTNVFLWTILVTYVDPILGGSRPILLCLSRNAWFVASQGALVWITSLINLASGQPELWGTDGTIIYRCFAGTGAVSYSIKTKLWDFGAFTQRKQMLRLSIQVASSHGVAVVNASADNEFGSMNQIALFQNSSVLAFTGADGKPMTFTGKDLAPMTFVAESAQFTGPVNQSGDLVGFDISGSSAPFILTGLAFEVKPMGEWT